MKKQSIIYLIVIIVSVIVLVNASFFLYNKYRAEIYSPKINPSDFTSDVTNRYFSLIPEKKMVYEANTSDGIERIEVYVTSEKKLVQDVETRVVWDRVWLNGELIEDTKDWYAQDKEGNVWYFGEDSKEIIDNKIVNTKGSWESGVDGAKSGIIMKANPKIGDLYRQEYYAGEAEDMGEVISLNETLTLKYNNFSDCIKTLDYTPLEPNVKEHKYYCPKVGGVVLEVSLDGGERAELISIEYNSQPSPSTIIDEVLTTEITEEKAKEIALKQVPGKVTDVAIEKKFGKNTYVVEIDADNGPETDVIIDINTGEVLGIET